MTINRKLFLAMAAIIVAMGLAFALLTQFVVGGILGYAVDVDRSAEIARLSERIADEYRSAEHSWERMGQFDAGVKFDHSEAGFLIVSIDGERLHKTGTADDKLMRSLGLKNPVTVEGVTVAYLYYYDREVANLSIIKRGVNSSVTFLLLTGSAVLVLMSLAVAFGVSRRLTAPLRALLSAIERLGKGELGIRTPVASEDEYGKIAEAFNRMSQRIWRAEEARRHMTADVAHELRTPITIIRGKLEWIQQSGGPVEPEALLPVQDELIRLTRLVDDLHQLSLAEARRLPLQRRPVSLPGLLEQVIERMSPAAADKQIGIRLECEQHLRSIDADPDRISQVFLNLIQNSIRYTPADGSIRISVEGAEEAATAAASTSRLPASRLPATERPSTGATPAGETSMQRVTVADTGIGIEPRHLPFVFDRFYRADETRARSGGGSGIGLAIAKELVLMHGGTIKATSRPGEGAVFTVALPELPESSESPGLPESPAPVPAPDRPSSA